MTFLSAVSIGAIAAITICQDGVATAPLSRDLVGYAKARTVHFSEGGGSLGLGIVITSDGLVLTPGEVAFSGSGKPRSALQGAIAKRNLAAKVVAFDPSTDLALVSLPPSATEYPFAELADRLSSTVVMVVLSDGPVRGQVVVSGISGVMAQNSRYLPLNEIRLDSEGRAPTGAPVFLPNGELAGLISAELESRSLPAPTVAPAVAGGMRAMEGFAAKLGPLPPLTAFALDLPVLERVIAGFKSAARTIDHPWIGLFFKTGPSPTLGAQITEVVKGSPGEVAGIRVGDTVIGSSQMPFRSHVEIAS
jgi:S1-C subfamily serine protease